MDMMIYNYILGGVFVRLHMKFIAQESKANNKVKQVVSIYKITLLKVIMQIIK